MKNRWVLSLDLKVETESQSNRASGSDFQVRGVAVLNDHLANDVRRNGTHSSGMDDDQVLSVLVHTEMCWLRYCADETDHSSSHKSLYCAAELQGWSMNQ